MGYLNDDGLARLWAKIKNYIDAHSSGGVTLDKVYPVGSIYMSVNNTNPGTLFGGTWEAWGAGRVPVGVNASDSDFSTAGKTGGEKTHTLTTNEMPSHKHSGGNLTADWVNLQGGANNISGQDSTWGLSSTGIVSNWGDATGFYGNSKGTTTKYKDGFYINASHSHSISGETGPSGSSNAHNNMQPYITCYMWKRTA